MIIDKKLPQHKTTPPKGGVVLYYSIVNKQPAK